MTEETILGLPKTIINSDDELMGIAIEFVVPPPLSGEKESYWVITYADAGSSISAKGKTLEEVVKKIKKEYKNTYGEEL